MNFSARHEKRTVGFSLHRISQRLKETRPARPTLTFALGRKQRQIAASAGERAFALLFVKRAAAGAFRAVLAQDHILVSGKSLAPIYIGETSVVDRLGRGHRLRLAKIIRYRER